MDVHRVYVCRDESRGDGVHVRIGVDEPKAPRLTLSRAPTSGGQYHWVSEFAPPQYQQFLSYVVGWMSTLSWQAGNAADCFLTGTIAQALIVVNNPSYEPRRWEGTLFVFAMVRGLAMVETRLTRQVFIVYASNTWGHDIWPRVQNGLVVLHVLAFLAVVVTLWCLAPHRTAADVFTDFSNAGDWSSLGLSLMVGQISAIYSILGARPYPMSCALPHALPD